MIDYFRTIVTGQYEAALCMLHHCIATCPDEHWEAKIANASFRWVAYHTLFFTDYYLSSEAAFQLRDCHRVGGDEREDRPCEGLERTETLAYLDVCRQMVHESLARETMESMQGSSGFSWHTISRGELHVYNIRHVQHHAGQLSAFLRKVGAASENEPALRWVRSGWRE
jgi:hypothetical protein